MNRATTAEASLLIPQGHGEKAALYANAGTFAWTSGFFFCGKSARGGEPALNR